MLASCASVHPNKFSGPNGKTAYSMRCSGMGRTIEDCYQKAGELCPSGYTIVGEASPGSAIVPVGGMLMVAHQSTLAIECK